MKLHRVSGRLRFTYVTHDRKKPQVVSQYKQTCPSVCLWAGEAGALRAWYDVRRLGETARGSALLRSIQRDR